MALSELMHIRMSVSELLPTNRGGKPVATTANVGKHKPGPTLRDSYGSDSSGSDSPTAATADARRRAGFDKLKDLPEAREDEELSEFDLSALIDADISTRGQSKMQNNRKAGASRSDELSKTLRTDELSEFDLNLLLEANISTRGERSTKRLTRHIAGFDKLDQLPETMHTDQLSEFDLRFLQEGTSATTSDLHRHGGTRVHHELVFASARQPFGSNQQMFLDDLYTTMSPTSRQNVRSFPM